MTLSMILLFTTTLYSYSFSKDYLRVQMGRHQTFERARELTSNMQVKAKKRTGANFEKLKLSNWFLMFVTPIVAMVIGISYDALQAQDIDIVSQEKGLSTWFAESTLAGNFEQRVAQDDTLSKITNILIKNYGFTKKDISSFMNSMEDIPPIPMAHDDRVRDILESLGRSDALPPPLEYLNNSNVKSYYFILKNMLPSRVLALRLSAQFKDYEKNQIIAVTRYIQYMSEKHRDIVYPTRNYGPGLSDVKTYIFNDKKVTTNLNDLRFLDFYKRFIDEFNEGSSYIELLPVASELFDNVSQNPDREKFLFSESFQRTVEFIKERFDFYWDEGVHRRSIFTFHLAPILDIAEYFDKNGFEGIDELIEEISRYGGRAGRVFHNDVPLLIDILKDKKVKISRKEMSLKELVGNRGFLISYIKSEIYSRQPVLRTDKDRGYSERPENFEDMPVLFLIRVVLMNEAMKNEEFLRILGERINYSRVPSIREHGGFLDITDKGGLKMNNVRSISDSKSFDPYVSLFFKGSAGHYHFHPFHDIKFAAPSFSDLLVADVERTTGSVFTTTGDTTVVFEIKGVDKKSNCFKVNVDIYTAFVNESFIDRPEDESGMMTVEDAHIIDLGEFLVPKPISQHKIIENIKRMGYNP